MILFKTVQIKVSPSNYRYWVDKGYSVPKVGGRSNYHGIHKIIVNANDLPPKSNMRVVCKCDDCERLFTNRFSRNTDTCYTCFNSKRMKGNKQGKGNSEGKGLSGPEHPRWNPNKTEYQKYYRRVWWLSEKAYRENKDAINPNDYPRTLCGIDGGYQLDHIVSVKKCFDEGMRPEKVASTDNLQVIPWKQNRDKWDK